MGLAARIKRQVSRISTLIGDLAEDMTLQIVSSTYNVSTGQKTESVSTTVVKGVLQHVSAEDVMSIDAGIIGLRALLFVDNTTPTVPVSSRLVVQGATYRVNAVKTISAGTNKLIVIVGLSE